MAEPGVPGERFAKSNGSEEVDTMADGKDETWRIKNEKRYAPKKDGGEFRRRGKSEARKIAERDERDQMVARMKRRMK